MKSIVISRSITPRDYSSLDKYFKELGSIHLISVEEEVSLAQRIRQNDKQAWERLVTANLRFVISVGDSDERDHHIPAQADHPFRGKLTRAFRGKLTTPNA